jgi:lipoprotein NlpI
MPSANSEEQSTSPPEERLEREMAGLFLEIAASSADLGDYAVAYQQACMSLEIVRTNGLEEALPFVLEVLGGYALQIEDYRAAYTYFDECLTLAEEIGDIRRIQSVEPRYQTARAKTILA